MPWISKKKLVDSDKKLGYSFYLKEHFFAIYTRGCIFLKL